MKPIPLEQRGQGEPKVPAEPPVVYPRQPDWYDKPPVPGLYVIYSRQWVNKTPILHCVLANQPDYLWYPRYRWYGPIPPDPAQK